MADEGVGLGELTRTVERLEKEITKQLTELKGEIVSKGVYEAEKVTTDLRITSLEQSRSRYIAATTALALGLIAEVLRGVLH